MLAAKKIISNGSQSCTSKSLNGYTEETCCWDEVWDVDGVQSTHHMCNTCAWTELAPRFCEGAKETRPTPPTNGIVSPQPPTTIAPPKLCPDGSSPDANGVCRPTTQAPTDQGTTLPPPKHHKGSNLGQFAGSLLNNNKNNPSPSIK